MQYEKEGAFNKRLKEETHFLIKNIYKVSKQFPREEIYGATSQLIMLNHVEGYARFKPKVKLNFYQISYGSLKEVKYLIYFGKDMGWINQNDYENMSESVDQIGKMLWSTIAALQKNT